MIEEFAPDSSVDELREARIDVPWIGPQQLTVEIIDGMAIAEGDIVLGPADEFPDIEEADHPEAVLSSVSLSGDDALWDDGVVPYTISSNLPDQDRVLDAIDHWEQNTPIDFVQRSGQDDYVEFGPANGCWSYIGRQGGRQKIGLAAGCGEGAVIHEIAHAVGIWHEQSRSDRDVYVTINWDNIQDGQKHNFRKHEGANDVGRYGYGSIMHYPEYAFTKNGNKTIEAPGSIDIGNRSGLSEGDIDSVFRMYGPSDVGAAAEVTDEWQRITVDSDVSPDSVVLAAVQTFHGDDPVGVRMRGRGGDAEVFLEEEQSSNTETAHTAEEVGFFATDEGTLLDQDATAIGEAGVVTTNQDGAGQWHTVQLDRSYSNPVVLMQVLSYNGEDPAHPRVHAVKSGSFKFQIEEWDYLDKAHTTEDVGYVVLEEGTHRLRNGMELTAGTVDTDHDWKSVSVGTGTGRVVISQAQTLRGGQAVVTRHRNVSSSGFDVRLQEEEGNNGQHRTETIGYLTVSQPETFEFGTARDEVTDEWSQLDYESDFQEPPVTVASIETYNGGNTASVRMRDHDRADVEVQIEEERSANDETSHIGEQVAYVATPEGPVHYANGNQLGEAGIVSRNQASGSQWHTIDLEESYQHQDPVVFAQLLSKNGGNPAHIRVQNVGATSFDMQIEEWDYLNQRHTTEAIGYIVLPSGLYSLPDGGLLQVGTARSNHEWTTVSLKSELQGGDTTVVSRCQTYNGEHAVVTRHRNVSASEFDVRLQEEEGNNGQHWTETIGFVAAVHDTES